MTAKTFISLVIFCFIVNIIWSVAEWEGFKAGFKRQKISFVLLVVWMAVVNLFHLNIY
jgi:hypothetical protein